MEQADKNEFSRLMIEITQEKDLTLNACSGMCQKEKKNTKQFSFRTRVILFF